MKGWRIVDVEWHVDGHPIAIILKAPRTKRTVRLAASLPPGPPPEEVMKQFEKLDPVGRLVGAAIAETIIGLRTRRTK
jgi:hypothetical protein